MLKSLIVGAVAGGVAYWLWGDQINRAIETGTRDLRARAADSLKQAESLVETATGTINETIHAGQEALRPASRSSLRSAK